MYWLVQAPANIALIKYMGKADENVNLADNASLSYTLDHLLSTVQLEILPGKKDIWEPLIGPGDVSGASFQLSLQGQKRFIEHLARIKAYFNYQGCFLIQSTNNFPSGIGLASSAASFAALTQCACQALSELTQKPLPSIDEQAQISRKGSGSSCRSFYSPWALWDADGTRALELPYKKLLHEVIIVSSNEKSISSSQAHQRVKTSSFYATRKTRAEDRLKRLLHAFMTSDWPMAHDICWQEFQDMHHLFRTCEQSFTYMTDDTLALLAILEDLWQKTGDGPIVTMDAGPNIHLLYRMDQQDLLHQFKLEYLVGNYDTL